MKSDFTEPGERGSAKDTRLIERAVRERWPVGDGTRWKCVERMRQVIDCEKASHREATAAARALVSMDKLTLLAAGVITEAPVVQVNVEVISQIRSQLLSDPKVLEAIRIVEAGEANKKEGTE